MSLRIKSVLAVVLGIFFCVMLLADKLLFQTILAFSFLLVFLSVFGGFFWLLLDVSHALSKRYNRRGKGKKT